MAEGVGFEPTVGLTTPVFKTGTLNRSDTPPKNIQFLTTKPFHSEGCPSGCTARLVF